MPPAHEQNVQNGSILSPNRTKIIPFLKINAVLNSTKSIFILCLSISKGKWTLIQSCLRVCVCVCGINNISTYQMKCISIKWKVLRKWEYYRLKAKNKGKMNSRRLNRWVWKRWFPNIASTLSISPYLLTENSFP
jgi:hypothetical protein